jgi:hypothetical protein
MRRIKIGSSRTGAVVMTGTSVRADSPHFITRAWRRAATPVTHASGIRSIASQRKSLFRLGSRAMSAHLAALSAAGRDRG